MPLLPDTSWPEFELCFIKHDLPACVDARCSRRMPCIKSYTVQLTGVAMVYCVAQENLQLRLELYLTLQAACDGRYGSCKAGALEKAELPGAKLSAFCTEVWALLDSNTACIDPCTHCHSGGRQHSKSFLVYCQHRQAYTHITTHKGLSIDESYCKLSPLRQSGVVV